MIDLVDLIELPKITNGEAFGLGLLAGFFLALLVILLGGR